MRSLHRIAGAFGVAMFVATGVYMKLQFTPAWPDMGMRLMFRSAHVYILCAGLANLLLAAYLMEAPAGRRRTTQLLGSVLLLLSPAAFTAAFFLEPVPGGNLFRPWCAVGLLLALAGTLLHAGRARFPGRPGSG